MTTVTDADICAAEDALFAMRGFRTRIASGKHSMAQASAKHREAAEARARLEGAEVMREAAADAFEIPDGEQWDDCCIDTLYDYECAILNLDPAAILEAHTRAKATGTLGDSDGDDGA